ncbi:PD-(D/E)XK nuclease domain-containing protein [Microcoleus sp. F4-D5]|uniref:PD-(D/E)XK nuclease domain-containing protein n=1 Tax=Microcoleus sp. F4-D5 TaxID=2818760 RepID=UPI002FD1E451
MLTSDNFKRNLAQFNELIAEGEAMYKAIQVIPGELYSPAGYGIFSEASRQAPERYVLDGDYDWEKWQTNYKLLLEKVIPLANSQRTSLIEAFSGYGNLKTNLETHLSKLKAVKENYEKGLLISSQSALGSFSLEDVSELLRRVPAGLRRWTWEEKPRTKGGTPRQWYIENEYHVQNLLYFLLAAVFPDIREEEYTRSVGQKKPRVDLEIPSLKLVIEIKFWYRRDRPQKIIGEIAEDTSLYLAQGSPHEQMIAFIWDDSRRTEEHDLLHSGIKRLPGIFDVVIVSRPGSMPDNTSVINEPDNE